MLCIWCRVFFAVRALNGINCVVRCVLDGMYKSPRHSPPHSWIVKDRYEGEMHKARQG